MASVAAFHQFLLQSLKGTPLFLLHLLPHIGFGGFSKTANFLSDRLHFRIIHENDNNDNNPDHPSKDRKEFHAFTLFPARMERIVESANSLLHSSTCFGVINILIGHQTSASPILSLNATPNPLSCPERAIERASGPAGRPVVSCSFSAIHIRIRTRASDPHSVLTLEFEYSWMHSPIACNAELLEEEYSDRYIFDMIGETLRMKVLKRHWKCPRKRKEKRLGTVARNCGV